MTDQTDLEEKKEKELLLKLTAEITIAKLSSSLVEPEALPDLIRSVYAALAGQDAQGKKAANMAARQQPAVPIKKSIFPDYIVCLEDGKKLKMLKRHLKSNYDLTPDQYREKWGLPSDYPLVAPSYAERRSALARNIGLGRNIGSTSDERRGAGASKGKNKKS